MTMHIFLTGFMGAGKSTVGKTLAISLGLPFIDLDQLIVETVGKSIKAIFDEQGESGFREHETSCLKTLSKAENAVVATGGGIINRHMNLDFMRKHGRTVYLQADWPTLKQRLMASVDRPLADKSDDWKTTKDLFLKRSPIYDRADIVVKTDHKSIQEIIDEIKKHV